MKPENDAVVIPFEDDKLEHKVTITRDDLPRQFVALANANGGKLKIGITNDGVIVGVKGISSEDITNAARDSCVPPIIPEIIKEDHGDGKEVILVKITKGNHPPYRTNSGRYLIRVGPTVRNVSLEELIDLIVRGPHRGTILLRAKLDDLKNSISASASPCSEAGNDRAIERINELIELTNQSSNELSKLDTIRVLGELSEMIDFNTKVSAHIIWCLPKISTLFLVPNHREYIPSEEMFIKIIDIVEKVFQTNTIVAEKTDMIVTVLNVFYHIALGCIWAGYENQKNRICQIINEPDGRDRKLSKYLQKALQKIEKSELEKDVFEPRRIGMLIERIEK